MNEPAADLAILGALVSSFKNKPIARGTLLVGEVGLSGEIRGVGGIDIRLKEAAKMGFKRAILPKSKGIFDVPAGFELMEVSRVEDVFDLIF